MKYNKLFKPIIFVVSIIVVFKLLLSTLCSQPAKITLKKKMDDQSTIIQEDLNKIPKFTRKQLPEIQTNSYDPLVFVYRTISSAMNLYEVGTGFFISEKGLILTAAHVAIDVNNRDNSSPVLIAYKKHLFLAKVVVDDINNQGYDAALLLLTCELTENKNEGNFLTKSKKISIKKFPFFKPSLNNKYFKNPNINIQEDELYILSMPKLNTNRILKFQIIQELVNAETTNPLIVKEKEGVNIYKPPVTFAPAVYDKGKFSNAALSGSPVIDANNSVIGIVCGTANPNNLYKVNKKYANNIIKIIIFSPINYVIIKY